jgi:hypothetical protein
MVDLPTISSLAAAVSVVVGVIFAVLELRHLNRTRKTEIIMNMYDRFGTKEMVEAVNKVGASKFVSLTDYREKYGFTEITEVAVFFEGLGVLLEQDLIDIDVINKLFGPTLNMRGMSCGQYCLP